jgi:predicted unusual protein kinase regulating ubiquinone biosynthesis (AarF/ABC1/UbiB family)
LADLKFMPTGNVGVEITQRGRPRLVLYDFGQAATLTQDQADGILQIIEAIIDMNVDRSIEAFQKMGVLVDGADLEKVRTKVAENYRTGKVKANRKSLRRKGYKFNDDDDATTEVSSSNTATAADPPSSESKSSTRGEDAEVMSFFTLPAEYAFVARAISQMDGVGKGLDPEFDFISNSAPYIVEIKGADKYLKDEAIKFLKEIPKRIARWQSSTLPEMYEKWVKGL